MQTVDSTSSEAETVNKSDYDAVCFLLRHAHDALDYHYYPVLRGLIRKALREDVNEFGQLTRESLRLVEPIGKESSDLGLHDDLGTAAGVKRMDEDYAAAGQIEGAAK